MTSRKKPVTYEILTPERAVEFAREQPSLNKPLASEFVPAMLELVAKGYDVEFAASQLTGNGCQCSTADFVKAFGVRVGRVV